MRSVPGFKKWCVRILRLSNSAGKLSTLRSLPLELIERTIVLTIFCFGSLVRSIGLTLGPRELVA